MTIMTFTKNDLNRKILYTLYDEYKIHIDCITIIYNIILNKKYY